MHRSPRADPRMKGATPPTTSKGRLEHGPARSSTVRHSPDHPRSAPEMPEPGVSSILTLKRVAGTAVELRRGPFEIVLDGNPAGSIDRNQTVELQTEPGPHTLQVKTGRYSSPTRSFDAADGTNIHFRCNSSLWWPRYLVSLLVPTIGLKLKREPTW